MKLLIANALALLLANVSPPGTARGTVIASPSRQNPDYYFMWVRDAALVMNVVEDRATQLDYVELSLHQQNAPAKSGLGEPKYNVDGTVFDGPWGRPQNDGPALRALTSIRLARQLLAEGKSDYVRTKLFDGKLPAKTLIKADLEYVAHHWREANFDLWEETLGSHFYTLLAQRAALVRGAGLASQLGNGGAAAFYRAQAREIDVVLGEFWSEERGYVVATRDTISGPDHASGLDVAVILAALHATEGGETFGVTDDRILATAQRLEASFKPIYQINQRPRFRDLGTAIGRYPEDRYNGYETNEHTRANPWFLATNAFAELYYRASREFARAGEITITPRNQAFFAGLRGLREVSLPVGQTSHPGNPIYNQILRALVEDGDRFIARTRVHANGDHLSEQFDKDSGYVAGAHDLTWSYASLITALQARPE